MICGLELLTRKGDKLRLDECINAYETSHYSNYKEPLSSSVLSNTDSPFNRATLAK